MSTVPEISVIVAARNAEDTLGETLDSLAGQTIDDFEVVVVDDASTDGTAEVASSHPVGPIVLKNTQRLGRGGSRNRAVAHSRGRYLAIHDADDWSYPNRLETTLNLALRYELVVASGQLVNLDSSGSTWRFSKMPLDDASIRKGLREGRMPCAHGASIVSREHFLAVGGYDPRLERCQDIHLFRRLADLGPFGNVSEDVLRYRHDWFLGWTQWHRNARWHRIGTSPDIDLALSKSSARPMPLRWVGSNTRRYVRFRRTRQVGSTA